MFNPPIIDALEFYCKLIQTPLEKKDGVITLEPTNIYYGKQALYLPLCNLKSYFYSEISTIKNSHPRQYGYGIVLAEWLEEDNLF